MPTTTIKRFRIALTIDDALALVDAMNPDDVNVMGTAHTVCVGGGFISLGRRPALLVDDVDAMLCVMLRSAPSPSWSAVVDHIAMVRRWATEVPALRLAA